MGDSVDTGFITVIPGYCPLEYILSRRECSETKTLCLYSIYLMLEERKRVGDEQGLSWVE